MTIEDFSDFEDFTPPPAVPGPPVEGPLTGMTICITGQCYEIGSRDYIALHLARLGATMKSGVSKKVTHLLSLAEENGRRKLARAKELGIPTLDETWLGGTFEKYGVAMSMAGFEADWAD